MGSASSLPRTGDLERIAFALDDPNNSDLKLSAKEMKALEPHRFAFIEQIFPRPEVETNITTNASAQQRQHTTQSSNSNSNSIHGNLYSSSSSSSSAAVS